MNEMQSNQMAGSNYTFGPRPVPVPLDFNNLPNNENPNGIPSIIPLNSNQIRDELPMGSHFGYQGMNSNSNSNGNVNVNNTLMPNTTYPPYSNNYPNNQENFNTGLNQIVRNNLISRGINLNNSPYQIKQQDAERKKLLLQNIQTQMNLSNNTKLKELEKRRKEDEKYLRDMVNSYPFGRGGGGAPVRDKAGNIVTTRRALISDPRYHHVAINVDDDYEEVWRKDKQFGLMNFMKRNQEIMNQNPYIPISERRGLRAHSSHDLMMNNNGYNNNNNNPGYQMQNNSQIINEYNPNNQVPHFYNQDMNNNYTNQPNPYQMFQPQPQPQPLPFAQTMPLLQPQPQPQPSQYFPRPQTSRNNNIENTELNISYENYEVDDEKRRREKEMYKNDLFAQMQENERRKQMEKEKKFREDQLEDERIKRESEQLKQQMEEENRKRKAKQDEFMNQYVVTKQKDKEPNNNTVKNYNNNNNSIPGNGQEEQKLDVNMLNQYNQEEIESRVQINNEILKLRNNIQEQQNSLLSQINNLKQETQNANIQRFEALKEISSLKEELSKQRADEELRRKYVYDVIVDNNSKVGNVYAHTKLPDINETEYKVELPKKENHSKNVKSLLYDDTIKYPNRVQEVPKLDEILSNEMKTSSKFIDIDTHNIMDGLEIYEPKFDKGVDKMQVNKRGYELGDDFGALRSYYNESDKPKEEQVKMKFISDVDNHIENDINMLEDNHLEVNQIYNKNMERLRYLNELEDKLSSRDMETKGRLSYSNFDELIGKINKTCEQPDY